MSELKINKECYGKHLIIDLTLRDIDCPNINDVSIISDYLDSCIRLVGMEEIGEITYKFIPYGITAIRGLSTSHLSIHTFPEYKYFSIDLYSCEDFDEQLIINYTKEYFDVLEMRVVEIKRDIFKIQEVRQWVD